MDEGATTINKRIGYPFLVFVGLILATGQPSAIATHRLVDLPDVKKTVILGASLVSSSGDVNGDGIHDMLLSRCSEEDDSRGRSWVVFGSPNLPSRLSLVSLGEFGFVIEGAEPEDCAMQISSAGDVNGDGADDVIVGASQADPEGRNLAGAAYVIFGKPDSSPVSLSDFNAGNQGGRGFRIIGGSGFSLAGTAVASAGDMNGDGRDDLLVEAPFAGSTYVIYGKGDSLEVDLKVFDTGLAGALGLGFRIDHPIPNRNSGSVAGAGDVNGDGIPDVMVGVIKKLSSPGTVYVIFGQREEIGPIDVTDLGDRGFVIEGRFGGSSAGASMTAAGDLNADGKTDLLIGAPVRNHCAQPFAYVVFGKADSDPVALAQAWKHGFQITDRRDCTSLGYSVSSLQDVNGDDIPELLIGAPETSPRGRRLAGASYVIYGKSGSRKINVRRLRQAGMRLDGARPRDYFGLSVAGVGDIDGDGKPEALIGSLTRRRSFLVDVE